jgi:hypothetical protein
MLAMLNFTGSLAEISDNFPFILALSISCCWRQGDLLREANDHLH